MQRKFEPTYTITPSIMNCLMRIESVKEQVLHLPLTPTVLASLRETARLYTGLAASYTHLYTPAAHRRRRRAVPRNTLSIIYSGGERGIRTLDTL